ncbi:hypothetical protein BaRGS_00003104 [Batillaria attramentaria]|uniref:Uncharacterized protein n=1 Tax=Batillaria attramentaria TaxID=370345 RepID=A0ABD0M3K5_9CAEN
MELVHSYCILAEPPPRRVVCKEEASLSKPETKKRKQFSVPADEVGEALSGFLKDALSNQTGGPDREVRSGVPYPSPCPVPRDAGKGRRW